MFRYNALSMETKEELRVHSKAHVCYSTELQELPSQGYSVSRIRQQLMQFVVGRFLVNVEASFTIPGY